MHLLNKFSFTSGKTRHISLVSYVRVVGLPWIGPLEAAVAAMTIQLGDVLGVPEANGWRFPGEDSSRSKGSLR